MQLQPKRLNARDAAAYLGLSYSLICKLRVYGGGPRYAKLARRVVYDIADLDAWVAKRARMNTSEAA
ncbi:transcriptional regulator [Rhodomicrobium udaipurense JA643]|uniref:DNA-binding protein n=1 Tax=Rhodomicrobium udaipurense TaxID=1202716 RepID=A0A8I1GIT9_9HYPH|nr:hypothetical protein [Rhodomicrobium udaipurense]KAI96089.1 transcriptional regulator [Rhodomicrobium udaipurense JA643]MBJ7545176.1 hypothetical protein [Rhodomicrobium udaipurense]